MKNIITKILLFIIFLYLPPSIPEKISFLDIATSTLNSFDRFWYPDELYSKIFEDKIATESERMELFKIYYTPLPHNFIASATLYGSDDATFGEILTYGSYIRQQMWRGWVLVGSGEYGYHPEMGSVLTPYIENFYSYKNKERYNYLLDNQAAPLYLFLADGGWNRLNRDLNNQPIPVSYDELNNNQKRMFDLTSQGRAKTKKKYFVTIKEQSKMSPENALSSGKYIAIVSCKSVNDFGRRFLIFKYDYLDKSIDFVGVVVCGGEAKRSDWTGIEVGTFRYFRWDMFPLGTRVSQQHGDHWAFDFPTSLYEYFEGTGSHVDGIIAIDPDYYK